MSLLLKKRKDLELRNKLEMNDCNDARFGALQALATRCCSNKTDTRSNGNEDTSVANKKRDVDNFFDDEEDEGEDETDYKFSIPQKFTKSGRKRAIPFPIKLMKVLSCKEYEHIICWTPSGKAFTIDKPKLFTTEILPEYFKTAKYSSFTRKLHRWGFMRHYRGAESGSFFHQDFMKGRLDLVEKMTCYAKADGQNTTAHSQILMERDEHSSSNQSATYKLSDKEGSASPPAQKERLDEAFYRNLAASMSSSIQHEHRGAVNVARRVSLPVVPSLPGPDPLSAREKLFKQFENCVPDLQSLTHPTPPSQQLTSIAAASSISEQLNAAIEAEVARRLTERLNHVALTKRALDMLQRPTQPVLLPNGINQFLGRQNVLAWNQRDLQTNALLQQELRNREALLSVQALSDSGSIASALPLAASLHALSKYRLPISYAATDESSNVPTLPPTNIQSAKTA